MSFSVFEKGRERLVLDYLLHFLVALLVGVQCNDLDPDPVGQLAGLGLSLRGQGSILKVLNQSSSWS